MGWIRNFSIILVLMWSIGGCLKQPESSVIPQIDFQNISFKKGSSTSSDTLTIVLKFTDGDGDLGIDIDKNETAIYTSPVDSTDINNPFYYAYDSVIKTNWIPYHYNYTPLRKGYKWVNYASHRTIHMHPFDTLPSNLNCKNWEFRADPADTLYIQLNPYHNNIFVNLYTKNSDGTYTYFDPTNVFPFGEQCVTNFFNGRFPILSSDLGKKSSVTGTITYKIPSAGLSIRLHGKTVKAKAYILDRAFHQSNIVESDDFVIPN